MKARLASITYLNDERIQYKAVWVFCPGCKNLHSIIVELNADKQKPLWSWDGDLECPTFEPSIKSTWNTPEPQVCHSFLRDGIWDFLSDSTHELAGQKVPMVELPDYLVDEI